MADEEAVPQVDGGQQDTPLTATGPQASDTPDYQAQLQERDAEIAKLKNDLKASSGRRGRQNQMEQLLLGQGNDIRTINSRLDALLKAMSSGETDNLPAELSAIQEQAAQTQATLNYETEWNELSQELVDSVVDDSGVQVLDLHNAPELATVREMWTQAHDRRDAKGLQRAVAEAQKVARAAERAARRTSAASVASDPEETGEFDLSTGPSAGGAGMSDDRWMRDVYGNSGYIASPEDHTRAAKILGRGRR
jgi:inosine/xanthosine triphosphate pyrophosphatase family protein